MSEEPVEVQVGNLLRSLGWTLALGESCTGGLIGHRLTQVPGASEYFLGGVVAYAYDAKERLLGVRHQTLYATARSVARRRLRWRMGRGWHSAPTSAWR